MKLFENVDGLANAKRDPLAGRALTHPRVEVGEALVDKLMVRLVVGGTGEVATLIHEEQEQRLWTGRGECQRLMIV